MVRPTGKLELRILARASDDYVKEAKTLPISVNEWRGPDADARRDNDLHLFWIKEAEDPANKDRTVFSQARRNRATWVKVPDAQRKQYEDDPNLVTRKRGDGDWEYLEKLVFLGKARAQWVNIGMHKDGPQKGKPRIDLHGTVVRPDGPGKTPTQVLVLIDDYHVTGEYLTDVSPGMDQFDNLSIDFGFGKTGARLFGGLTGDNLPAGGVCRRLGIVLDDELLSAPNLMSRITKRGQITGRFSHAEIDDMINILDAGSLPVVLKKEPVSVRWVEPGEAVGR